MTRSEYERYMARRDRALARLHRRKGQTALAALFELYERQRLALAAQLEAVGQ